MKRLSFFSVLLMAAGVFLFLGGCQKDEEKFLEAHQKNSIEKNLMPLDSFPKAKRYIEKQLRNIGDRNAYFSTTDIDYSQTLVAVTGYNERTYSLALDQDPSEGWIYNIVMHEEDGIIDNVKIVGIRRLTNSRMLSYQYSLEEGFGKGSRSLSLKECIRSHYVSGNGSGNSGGGGSNGDNPFGNSGGDGISNGVIYWNYGNSGGGSGDPGGDPGPGGGGSGGGSGGNPGDDCDTITPPPNVTRVLIWNSDDDMEIYEPFNPINGTGTNTGNLGTTAVNGSRDLSEDCKDLLKKYGILNKNGKLDEDKLDELLQDCRESVPDLRSMIDEMAQSNLTNPCDNTPYEIDAEGIELELCLSGDYSRGGLQRLMKEALDAVDYIDNNISDPRLNCLWNKLMKSNNNVICEQISYYEGKTKLNLSIWSQAFNGVNGSTTIDDNGQVAIQFNETNLKNKCDIEIIKTMIHESVHAGILNVVKGTHINGWGVDDVPDLKYYYDNFTDFHHEYMAGNYFDNLVKSLKQIYSDKYSDAEYEALMWNGLHNTLAYKKLSAAKRNEIESIWDEFKNSKTCEKSCL